MRTGILIILFIAVAGLHSATSACLELDDSNESEETDEYEAAHVGDEESLGVTHVEEKDYKEIKSDTDVFSDEEDDDGEKEALTETKEMNTGSDEPVDTDFDIKSTQKREHNEQTEENVKSAEDFIEEEDIAYYHSLF